MNIGLVGAGILGQLTALKLVHMGHNLTVFYNPKQSSCSQAAAGLLTPHSEMDKSELAVLTMGAQSLDAWEHILSQLETPVYFQRQGSLLVAHPSDLAELHWFQSQYQKKTQTPVTIIRRDAIQEREPELSKRFDHGIYLPDEGQIAPQEILHALSEALRAKGVVFQAHHVDAVRPYAITTRDQDHAFDCVIDCRGLGAQADYPSLRGVRGELIYLQAPEVQIQRIIRLMHPRYTIYLAPRQNHQYILGASLIESQDTSPISVQTLLELLSAVYSLHPGFAQARVTHTAVSCRPAFPDHLPKIKHTPGLIAANGLYRHGYLLSPYLSDSIIDMIPQ